MDKVESKTPVLTKAIAKQWLVDVPEDKVFWCSDGKVFKNLMELEAGLREMSDDTFRYHFNENKSDFSTWVRDVIGDDSLARDLQRAITRSHAARLVSERISSLKRRAGIK